MFSFLFALCIQLTMYGHNAVDPFENNITHRGINLYLTQLDVDNSQNFEWDTQLFLDRAAAAGLNSISLTWPVFVDSSTGNHVFRGDSSLTAESVELFLRIARARGFGVWLNPLIDEQNLMTVQGGWRGNIRPTDPDKWMRSYHLMLQYYTQAAQAGNANGFVIATELWSMESQHVNWQKIVYEIRRDFDGLLTYSSNRPLSQSDFMWSLVDVIAVNYFPNLNVPNNVSVETLHELISRDVGDFVEAAENLGLPLIVKETGVTSQLNALRVTGRWNHKTRPDHETQRRFYEATCRAWTENSVGIYWWNTSLHPIPENLIADDVYFSPFGKPAEKYMSCEFER